jgi:peroxiredoxin
MTVPTSTTPDREALESAVTQEGTNLADLTEQSPVLLVFLRHLGCAFCRETLGDIADRQEFLQERKIRPVLVHMAQAGNAENVFKKYGLENVLRISDPSQDLYRAFGLGRASFWQLLNPIVLGRMFMAAVVRGHGAGLPVGDPMQMPGVFLLHRGKIVMDFRHRTIADRPDYRSMAQGVDESGS